MAKRTEKMIPVVSIIACVQIHLCRMFNVVSAVINRNHRRACSNKSHPTRGTVGLLFVGLLLPIHLGSTALAAIRTPTALVISQDSKLRYSSTPYCKVRPFGPVVIGVVGFINNPKLGYDVFKIANDVIGMFDSFSLSESHLVENIKPALSRALERLRRADIVEYRKDTKDGKALKLALLSFVDEPRIVVLTFLVTNEESEPVSMRVNAESCPGKDCANGFYNDLEGEPKEIETARTTLHDWKTDPIKAVQYFVNLEITSGDKRKYGPPRVTLEILKGNHLLWIEYGACPK